MANDDELTVTKLHVKLLETFPTLNMSVSTVKRARMEPGWTAKDEEVWCFGVRNKSRKASGVVQGTDGDGRHGF